MNLKQFIASDLRNAWIKERYINAYVRKSYRLLGESVTPCLDLANIEVLDGKRSKGVFTRFRECFELAALECGRWVYVECVQSKRLAEHLLKMGYFMERRSCMFSPNFFKPTDNMLVQEKPPAEKAK